MKKRPELFIVGGPNGCGKTTIAMEYSKHLKIPYLSADDFANKLKGKNIKNFEVRAGKQFFDNLDKVLDTKASVLIESTLSGIGLLSRILKFQAHGYSISIIFVFLESVDLCKKRIKIRVKKGGHNVKSTDVERRYKRSIQNFWKKYRFVADSWQILYNGKNRPIEVAINEGEVITIFDEEYYQIFRSETK